MTYNLKSYPTYKPSGVEWLGDVPAHWEIVPNRVLMELKKDLVGDRPEGYTLLSLTKQGIIARDMENLEGKFPTSFDTYQVVESGDLIFCLFDIDETPRTVGLAGLDGMITGAYTRFVCEDVTVRAFLFLLYLSLDNSKLLKPLYSGLRKVIQKTTFLSAKVALPPRKERIAIATFLDQKTTEIDEAINKKQRLIELLKEQKAILINQAVTKGLNPNVPMRDSGVEWIGEVPAHWEVKRMKHLFRLVVEPAPTNNDMELLSIYTDIGVRPRRELEERGNRATTTDGYWKVKKGDFIVNKLLAWMGAIGLSSYEGVTSPAYDILRPQKEVVGEYFHYLFRTSQCSSELKKHSRGIMEMRLRLYFDKFGMVLVPFPPTEEQVAIAAMINLKELEFEEAIERVQKEISLLQEYRTILIANVVTGKLDVREDAPRES